MISSSLKVWIWPRILMSASRGQSPAELSRVAGRRELSRSGRLADLLHLYAEIEASKAQDVSHDGVQPATGDREVGRRHIDDAVVRQEHVFFDTHFFDDVS